tara:strand:+ start:51 stop:401 length:351 start_codon:yes stop_codon:yes gene_type:complete
MGGSIGKQVASATARAGSSAIKGIKATGSTITKGLKSTGQKITKGIKRVKAKITGFGRQGTTAFKEGDPIRLGKTINTQARGRVGREGIKKVKGIGGRDYKQATDIYTDMLMNPNL